MRYDDEIATLLAVVLGLTVSMAIGLVVGIQTARAIHHSLADRQPQAREEIVPYDRLDWGGWTDDDEDCRDVRDEALVEAAGGEYGVVWRDMGQCRVDALRFTDPYTGELVALDASKVDIDHLVPLHEAHYSGGAPWNRREKLAFFNDPENLFATTQSVNRSKGDRDPAGWKPPDRASWCWYALQWISVKEKYRLSFDEAESVALFHMLATCQTEATHG